MRNLFAPLMAALVLMSQAGAEVTTHDFNGPPTVGIPTDVQWPAQILDTDFLTNGEWAGDLSIRNNLNNTLFVDGNYLASGVAPGISGKAMWANPRSGEPLGDPYLEIYFDGFFAENGEGNLVEKVTQVAFDVAWASTDAEADLSVLEVEITDYDGYTEYVYASLDETFDHSLISGGVGHAGRVVLAASEVSNIYRIQISNLVNGSPPGITGEFAIDNLTITHRDFSELAEVYPVYNDGSLAYGYSTNSLKGVGLFGFTDAVYNGSDGPATFSVSWNAETPGISGVMMASGVSIEPEETYHEAFRWEVDTDSEASGLFAGEYTVTNDGDSGDPDNAVHVEFRLYDPPALSSNAGTPLTRNDQVSLSNEEAAGHPGALRASVEVTAIQIGNPRFSLSNIKVGSRLDPGGQLSGTVRFPGGAPAGTYTTQLRLKLKMTSTEDYLNSAEPVEDLVWDLSYTVGSANTATQTVTNGQDLGAAEIQIAGSESGAALIGGTSEEDQEIELAFEPDPPQPLPTSTGSAVTVNFGVASPIYVLELSFGELPSGYAEADLRVKALSGGSWVPAISLNGNGGTPVTGAKPYAGSYLSYLATLGGGSLNAADLGAYGVDAAANTVWIVVDYSGLFQIALGSAQPNVLPAITGISRDPITKAVTISYQSISGVTFTVEAGTGLGNLNPIGTTPAGTGSVMQFIHQAAGAPDKYFYRFTNP
ncbi:hypothetical protein [Luteolibacter sp. Populi]|uniref:hypothetical protein n=1 Tax=Luteolibacter sp. Populi TaxID=3230487 RepID=UPI003466E999